ncbi:MAG: RagB/SusD family nutrient uptake outer membrane protein, partial [Chitinophagaceae bacterium]
TYNTIPSTQGLYARWISIYDGIARANDVIKIIAKTKAKNPSELSADDEKRALAEARFIRAFQHFEAKKMWNNIPIITDTTTINPGNGDANNAANAWKFIEDDLSFAYANLPESQSQLGRVHKWAAAGYLAKAYLYQKKFTEALALFNTIINTGKNVAGNKLDLQDAYWKNFDPRFENSEESVFSVQMAAQGSQEGDGNRGYGLAFPYGGDFGCCGFLQPSQNLVNAYKTDAVTGLPLLTTYNNVDLTNDETKASSDPFTLGAEPVDPRLDWSVGRRPVPFWDWGAHPGRNWIRDIGYAGPYSPKKHVYSSADVNSFTANGWRNVTAKNYNALRFADLLLMAAECEVEVGSLENARALVNRVRTRAKNKASWVEGSPANYVINTYTTAWTDKSVAREAVRFERRLELAMEGHRFFDLTRYGNGYAKATLNAYLNVEKNKRIYLKASPGFNDKNEYYPIPERAIVLSYGKLKQNPGY